MKLLEALQVLPFYDSKQLLKDVAFNTLQIDHQLIAENDIFICINGFTVDGHDYAEAAVKNGAKVIIVERDITVNAAIKIVVPDTNRALSLLAAKLYNYPSIKFPLVGITGTNGKTTTSYILDEIFQQANHKVGLIGTIQAKIGDELIEVKNTTPDALQLQQLLAKMHEKQVSVGIMEVSSHALDLGRVYGTDFDVAVFTNLSQDHLDYHESMADYLRAKTLLFTYLGNTYIDKKKLAVLNRDDKHSDIIAKSTAQHIITYGVENAADVMAQDIVITASGTSFQLYTPKGNIQIDTPLIGKFNVYNMLAAATVALFMDVSLEMIKHSLHHFSGVGGRFEQVRAGQEFTVIVDYAHTPDSLENVLQTVTEFKAGKLFVVVGTGGDRDKSKRPLMANVATKYADTAIFTTDNPRTESPESILGDMLAGLQYENYQVIEDRKQAIEQAIKMAEEDDIILIAGKGHETYQEINRVRYDFDDRLVAKKAIKQRGI